jgi:hypothetical protein
MKKVTLIGDCHTARFLEHYNPKKDNIDLVAWGKAGLSAWKTDPIQLNFEKTISSGTENAPIYLTYGEHLKIDFSKIENKGLILPWLGYIDIRQHLPEHKNTEFVVKQYVDRFISYFDKAEVRFVEPLPQFIPILLKYPGVHPEYTFEERMQENECFINYLKKYSKEYGLKKPISQKEMFDALGFKQNEMTEDKAENPIPHPFDKFKKEHFKKIYDLIISEASK